MSSAVFSMNGLGCPCTCSAPCCFTACSPCPIPKKDLTISWVNPLTGNGSDTLVYNGTSWATGCSGGAGAGNQVVFSLACTGGNVILIATFYTSGTCPTGAHSSCTTNGSVGSELIPGTTICGDTPGTPFSMTVTLTNVSCPALSVNGYTSFTISDTSPVTGPVMCYGFIVTDCFNSLPPGAAVSVYTSMGGALLATGTTGSFGTVHLSWTGTSGNYYVTASVTGWTSYAGTLNLTCAGQSSIILVIPTLTLTDSLLIPAGVSVAYDSVNNWYQYTLTGMTNATGCGPCSCNGLRIMPFTITWTLTCGPLFNTQVQTLTQCSHICPDATGPPLNNSPFSQTNTVDPLIVVTTYPNALNAFAYIYNCPTPLATVTWSQ